MTDTKTYTQTIRVETRDAVEHLNDLHAAIERARQAKRQAMKDNDYQGVARAKNELRDAQHELKAYENALHAADLAARDLGSASYASLKRAARQLTKSLHEMERGTEQFARTKAELERVNSELRRAGQEVGEFSRASRQLDQGGAPFRRIGSAILGMLSPIASATGALALLRKGMGSFLQFEERIASLSALTGLKGDDLQALGDRAKQMSRTMTASATEVLDAFTLMGSAKPELLKDREALADVTQSALTLAEASRMTASEAVSALAATMNQFGASADQADRYINTLAAGSKAGAAAVGDISSAIIRFGAQAASANVSVEESVALIETLAEKGIKGEAAGTALKGVLLKLQTGADEFNPSVVGLSHALENLAAANLTTAQKVKMFGEGNVVAAQILMEGREAVEGYTQAVSGTQTAFEQAMTNSDTLGQRLQRIGNAGQLALIGIGERIAPLVESLIDGAESFARTFHPILTAIGSALEGVLSIVGGLASGIASLGTHIMDLVGYNASLEAATRGMNESITQQTLALGQLTDTAANAAAGSRERAQAIDRINQQYGQYLPHLLTEKSSLEEIRHAQELATQAIEHNAAVKAKQMELDRLSAERMKTQVDLLRDMREEYAADWGADTAANMREAQRLAGIADQAQYLRELRKFADSDRFRLQHADKAAAVKMIHRLRQETQEYREEIRRTSETFDTLIASHPAPTVRARGGQAAQASAEPRHASPSSPSSPPPSPHHRGVVGASAPPPADTTAKSPSPPARPAPSDEYDHEAALLDQWLAAKRAAIAKSYRLIHKDKARYQKEEEAAQLAYLAKQHAHLQKKIDTLRRKSHKHNIKLTRKEQQEIDRLKAKQAKIEDRQRKMLHARLDKERKAEQAKHKKHLEEKHQAEQEATQKQEEENQKRADLINAHIAIMRSSAESTGQMLGDLMTSGEASMKSFTKSLIMMGLDALHKVVQIQIAKIWSQAMASPESVMSWGAAGAAKAAALTVLVEGAYQAAKNLVAKNLYDGRLYPVLGQQDGQHYEVPYAGEIGDVALIPNPTLISERGGEIVIDHARSQNIIARYPHLLEQIRAVPQHADGTLPPSAGARGPSGTGAWGPSAQASADTRPKSPDPATRLALERINRTLDTLERTLSAGIAAHISIKELSRNGFQNRNDKKWGIK